MDATPTIPPTEAVDVLATPAVRRMANELNVDLNEVMMMLYL
jgi:pyruvate/2-oxoglutarate dehydrogenase complex dihydrolipoamide acyltransferase (E2) component